MLTLPSYSRLWPRFALVGADTQVKHAPPTEDGSLWKMIYKHGPPTEDEARPATTP